MSDPVDINAQINHVEREHAARARRYPQLVRRGLITRDQADLELATLRAIANTLKLWKIDNRTYTGGPAIPLKEGD